MRARINLSRALASVSLHFDNVIRPEIESRSNRYLDLFYGR